MPITVSTRALIGKGKIGLRNRTKGGGLRYVGYTSEYTHAIATDKKTLPNYETAGGGNAEVLERVSSYTGSIKGHSFSAENLALATRGNIVSEAAAAVADEAHTAYSGTLIIFDHLPDLSAGITVAIDGSGFGARANTTAVALGATIVESSVIYQCTTAGTTAAVAPTFNAAVGATTTDGTVAWTSRGAAAMVDGTDYQLGKSGIEIPATATRFASGLPILVSYSQNAAAFVQLLTESQDEYEVVLDGLNEVDNGNPMPVRMFRVKFSPTSGLGFKTDDFAEWTLQFEALPDAGITGTGLSQYGTIGIPV